MNGPMSIAQRAKELLDFFRQKPKSRVVWFPKREGEPDRSVEFQPIGAVPLPSTEHVVSKFDDSVLKYVGEPLKFETQHGHGWVRTESWNDVPGPFVARLIRLYEYRGNRRGGVAKVEQPGHRCDGLWVMFATRHVGVFNFTDHPAHCNVALFRAEPPKPVDDGSFWVMKGDMPGLKMAGFAEIVAAR